MTVCNINKVLLPLKASYFLLFAASACIFPFLPVFFVSLGIPVWQVGLLRGLDPIIAFLCSLLWGGFADKFGKHRFCLTLAIIGGGVFYFFFLLVPYIVPSSPLPSHNSYNSSHCDRESASFEVPRDCLRDHPVTLTQVMSETDISSLDFCEQVCEMVVSDSGRRQVFATCTTSLPTSMGNLTNLHCATCDLSPNKDDVSNTVKQRLIVQTCQSLSPHDTATLQNPAKGRTIEPPENLQAYREYTTCSRSSCCQCEVDWLDWDTSNSGRQEALLLICVVLTVLSVAFSCNVPSFIDAATMMVLGDDSQEFGKQRLWGTIGWGLVGCLGGLAVDLFTRAIGSPRRQYEPLFVIHSVTMILLLITTFLVNIGKFHRPQRMQKNLLILLQKPPILMFLAVLILQGASLGMSFSYLMIYWQEELGATTTMLGLSLLVSSMAETPALYVSGWVISRIGHQGVVYLTQGAYAVRYFLYGVIRNPWAILPVQLLHGITFGIGWPGFTMYANEIAPEGMTATFQSVKTSAHSGIGFVLGNLVGGLVYQQLGARTLFLGNAALSVIMSILFFIVERVSGGYHNLPSDQRDCDGREKTPVGAESPPEETGLNVMDESEASALRPEEEQLQAAEKV